MTYAELSTLAPHDYLNPNLFRTPWDTRPEYGQDQYNYGLDIGRRFPKIFIGANSVWSAQGDGTVSAYEGIGYHSHTADLLSGFLASPAEVWVYRNNKPNPVRIK